MASDRVTQEGAISDERSTQTELVTVVVATSAIVLLVGLFIMALVATCNLLDSLRHRRRHARRHSRYLARRFQPEGQAITASLVRRQIAHNRRAEMHRLWHTVSRRLTGSSGQSMDAAAPPQLLKVVHDHPRPLPPPVDLSALRLHMIGRPVPRVEGILSLSGSSSSREYGATDVPDGRLIARSERKSGKLRRQDAQEGLGEVRAHPSPTVLHATLV